MLYSKCSFSNCCNLVKRRKALFCSLTCLGKSRKLYENPLKCLSKTCNNLVKDRSVYCSRKCFGIEKSAPFRAQRSEFRNYQADCQFRFALKDYPDRFNFALIEQHGWYTAANRGGNLDGVSRDHMFSISDGFSMGVSPEIIRHPANCELVTQRNNSSKKSKSSITLEQLQEKISKW